MTDRLYQADVHHLAGQQTQRPVGISLRRGTQAHRHDLGFLLTIQSLIGRGTTAFGTVESHLKPWLNSLLSNILNGLGVAIKGFRNSLIDPI
jgi:hypothetical protein